MTSELDYLIVMIIVLVRHIVYQYYIVIYVRAKLNERYKIMILLASLSYYCI